MNRQINWLLFFILAFIVGYTQYLLLGLVFNYGFTPDDWGLLFFYKTLGNDPLSKIPYVWSIKGAYTTSQVYFIGILNNLFGLNYQAYQITNIIFKTLATLSLYPLILIIFKRKLLAFLTTLLYGMSYMGSRSLEYVVKGTDYLAIIPMSIFFIIYYYIITQRVKNWWWFILMSFFWFTSLMVSPIRIYPILILIPLIEITFVIQNRSVNSIANSFKRLLVLYLPFLPIYLYKPPSTLAFLQNPPVVYQAILNGNLHLILTPFQGVGLSVFFTAYWNRVFGSLSLESFRNYLYFLIGGPLFIFGILSYVLSIVKFKKSLRAFIKILCLTFTFSLASFFIANYLYGKTEVTFDPNRIYPLLIGGFMLAISIASFLEWKNLGKKDHLLLALWVSPLIILLYTSLIWVLAPLHTGFEGQQGYYLVVPAIASSLFLATILVVILDRGLNLKSRFSRSVIISIFFICLIFLYLTNGFNTYHYYISAGKDGRLALDQDRMFNQVSDYLDNLNYSEPNLLYFDVSEDSERGIYYYEESLFHSLPIRMLLRNDRVNDGCIGIFYRGIDSLGKLVAVRSDVRGFISQGQCIKNDTGGNTEGVFYKIDNLHAFKIKGRELIDITPEVLERLGFK